MEDGLGHMILNSKHQSTQWGLFKLTTTKLMSLNQQLVMLIMFTVAEWFARTSTT
jgi:hypothetical protein